MRSEADMLFARGLALHQQGKLTDARRLYGQALARAPRHAAALHHLGIAAMQSGEWAAAADLVSAAIGIDGAVPETHTNLARCYATLGRFDDALLSYDRALAINPRLSGAHLDRGNVLLRLGRAAEAAASFERAHRLNPKDANSLNGHGNALLDLGKPEEALAKFEAAILLEPQFPAALFNRGNALRSLLRIQEAVDSYDRVLAAHPQFVEALINRGLALQELERYGESLSSLARALEIAPELASLHFNRAVVLLDLKRPAAALSSVDRALGLQPDSSESLNCRGIALLQLNRSAQALESLDRALALRADYPDALHNRGIVLLKLRRYEEALASFEAALSLRPGHAPTVADAGRVLMAAGRHSEARRCFARALEMDPDYDDAIGNVFYADQHCAEWSTHDEHVQSMLAGIDAGRRVASPFSFLSASDSAAAQRRCAEILCARVFPPPPPLWAGERYGHARIRIGYLSSDLREHALSYLLCGVFEQHDRSRFEVSAWSLNPPDASAMGMRVQRAFDHFEDLSRCSDAEAAARIRAHEIDVLVDLNGYTHGMRPAILAQRPAAVQVNYLGFPGTMGAPFIDYLVADRFLIPAAAQKYYSERIAYLPECFQANDDRRPRAAGAAQGRGSARSAAGLPEHALVLCSFNNTFKLNPTYFDIWMRALNAAPSSVLWLLGGHPALETRFRALAAERGVDPGRLKFAPRLPYAEHLARCALADLVLDSLPFNAGTTASDALWAGVPILTCAGEAFAARMAGSLLTSLGLPELITHGTLEYERRLFELLEGPQALAEFRARLERQREFAPLFDTRRFTRHLEAAFERMHRQRSMGEAPSSFYVDALPAGG